MNGDNGSDNSLECKHISQEILKYLSSKGKIKAALLNQLFRRFGKKNSGFKVKKKDLLGCLMKMFQKREIDFIIPEPFDIQWRESVLNNLKFLQNNSIYLTRYYSNENNVNLGSYSKNGYYFDSRQLNLEKQQEIADWIKKLNYLIKKVPNIKYLIIIYLESEPLTIYEPFQGDYILKFRNFNIKPQASKNSKIIIPLEQQRSDLSIIQSYRANYQCFYIRLIESIQKTIYDIQKNKNIPKYKETLRDHIRKFAYHCIMYVWSDWVEANHGWESFFRFFNIPVKTLSLDFENIKFQGRTFETFCRHKFCLFIDKNCQQIINKLKLMGYKEFKNESDDNFSAIGLNLKTFIPCSTIEHFYFTFKYIYYHNFFTLFFHAFDYIKNLTPRAKFTETDRNLYKVFSPLICNFFGIEENDVTDKLIFKYYTYNPDELEIIYNRFLLEQVKIIEKKLFRYFLFKSSR